jgi:hypothetical protein
MPYKDEAKQREADLKYRKRVTLERTIDRLCRTCGQPLLEEETLWCLGCRVKRYLPMRQLKGVLKYATAN